MKFLDYAGLSRLVVWIKEKIILSKTNQENLKEFIEKPSGKFVCTLGNRAAYQNEQEFRRQLTLKQGFGNIHMDIKGKNGSGYLVATLPENSPMPITTYEVMLFGGRTVWIDEGTRDIKSAGLQHGQRYIFDIWGYFE